MRDIFSFFEKPKDPLSFSAIRISLASPEKIREAAGQFESLMIGQVFKTVHEDDEGWLGTGDDQTGSSAMGMADDYLAQSISKGGGLGLAKMIARQLGEANAAESASEASPAD